MRPLLAPIAVGVLLTGCGGGTPGPTDVRGPAPATRPAPGTRTAPPNGGHGDRAGRPSLDRVPRVAKGSADAGRRRVAEAWFARVRRGRDYEAAALMADGARFVNGGAVRLGDEASRVAAAASLPCGATPVKVGGAPGGYVVLRLRLTEKAGRPCAGGGELVSVAVRVRDGRIDDWVRLPAGPGPGGPAPQEPAPDAPDGSGVTV